MNHFLLRYAFSIVKILNIIVLLKRYKQNSVIIKKNKQQLYKKMRSS